MRKIREVLRLRFDLKLSQRQIGASCGLCDTTVGNYLRRAGEAGLGWPLPEGLDDLEIEARLFSQPMKEGGRNRPLPDWGWVHSELRRKGVTLALLWQEYRAQHPDGYRYSNFVRLYRLWAGAGSPTMRLDHKAGEKLFVDYAGMTLPITDPSAGEVGQAQVFVATLGASSYTYAEVTGTQGLEDWLSGHRRALEFFGGVPQIVVPDNLKAGVRVQGC